MRRVGRCDEMIAPTLQPVPRRYFAQAWLLRGDDVPELGLDHLADEGVFVGEVVVELRSAGLAGGHDGVQACSCDAALSDQRCRFGDDAGFRCRPAVGQPRGGPTLFFRHGQTLFELELSVHFFHGMMPKSMNHCGRTSMPHLDTGCAVPVTRKRPSVAARSAWRGTSPAPTAAAHGKHRPG